ncbi:MAG: hypothetical protein QOI24_4218 [Acidobacteriota bacterium]|jgi:hypothetical protein|nr:hypothetical protein [Acidobacteriota bacterium]
MRARIFRFIRLGIVAILFVAALAMPASADYYTCQDSCNGNYYGCLATCQWWNILCRGTCMDLLDYCTQTCNGNNHPDPIRDTY